MPDLETTIIEFSRLQEDLLTELHKKAGTVLSEEAPHLWPTSGVISVGKEQWRMQKHGLGYSLHEVGGSRHVEAHQFITSPPYPIDAYRISCYLKSIGSEVSFMGKRYDAEDLKGLQEGLDSLCTLGVLKVFARTSNWPIRSYLLTTALS